MYVMSGACSELSRVALRLKEVNFCILLTLRMIALQSETGAAEHDCHVGNH